MLLVARIAGPWFVCCGPVSVHPCSTQRATVITCHLGEVHHLVATNSIVIPRRKKFHAYIALAQDVATVISRSTTPRPDAAERPAEFAECVWLAGDRDTSCPTVCSVAVMPRDQLKSLERTTTETCKSKVYVPRLTCLRWCCGCGPV